MAERHRLRAVLETILAGEMVPFISIWIVVVGILLAGFDYAVVVESATLLFYAVLVGVWTSLAPTQPLEEGGNYAQLQFLMISVAAVVMGLGVEVGLALLGGQMYPIQALALAFLGSRLYVNALGTEGSVEMLRLHRRAERYLVYIPCLGGLLLPIVVYQAGVTALFGYGLASRQAAGIVGGAALLAGAVALVLVEGVWPRLRARWRRARA